MCITKSAMEGNHANEEEGNGMKKGNLGDISMSCMYDVYELRECLVPYVVVLFSGRDAAMKMKFEVGRE